MACARTCQPTLSMASLPLAGSSGTLRASLPRRLRRRYARVRVQHDDALRHLAHAARFGSEVALEILLAVRDPPLLLHRLDAHVGVDAVGLDRASARRVVARDGQAHPGAARERDDGLHASLAERRLADHARALLILQGAGDELRRARGVLVDEDDARLARERPSRVRLDLVDDLTRGAASCR